MEVEVTSVGDREVVVRLADGRIGVIVRGEFDAGSPPSVGSTVPGAVLARDDPKGRVVLSHEWARRQLAWERLVAARANAEGVSGPVVKVVKGGLVVDLGIRAFLPSSMIEEGPVVDVRSWVGRDVTVLVVELDEPSARVVVSRRDFERRVRRQAEKAAFATLSVGAVVTGTVVAVQDYGLHLDILGVRGLLHRTELAWGHPPRPREVAAVGDELEVVVVEMNRGKHRLGLSLRRREADPLAQIAVGEIHSGVVTKMLDYGVLVSIDGHAIDGLVHMMEMSELPGARPDQLVTPGEGVVVKILSIDRDRRRVALSMRQAIAG